MRAVAAGMKILLAIALPAWADVRQGEAKAQLCFACHKPRPDPASLWVPLLEGQPKPYLVASMAAFKSGARNEPSMNANVRPLSAQDMQSIAEFFSTRPFPATSQATEPVKVELGGKLANEHQCASCHRADYKGSGGFPRLAGQHYRYLGGQMQAFSQGRREGHGSAPIPTGPQATEALAQFFASLK
jgi:cytochrome c553